mmetsp:Transcript_22186/g.48436  ORF Transcript_22186/g.48436 Transcript_22186/m.48436 type:complete len:103 (-) Transcript_22186:654-962(-)
MHLMLRPSLSFIQQHGAPSAAVCDACSGEDVAPGVATLTHTCLNHGMTRGRARHVCRYLSLMLNTGAATQGTCGASVLHRCDMWRIPYCTAVTCGAYRTALL